MRRLREFVPRLRFLFRRVEAEQRLSEELQFHLDRQIEQHLAAGMSTEEARYAALRLFGGVEQTKEECRDMRRLNLIEDLIQDVRYGLRQLRRTPGFTVVVILVLALGIGANTAIFSLIDAVLLRSLPVRAPQELVVLQWSAHRWPTLGGGYGSYGDCVSQRFETAHQEKDRQSPSGCSLSQPFFNEVRSRTNLFSGVTAFAHAGPLSASGSGPATIINGQAVSGDYFETLGVRAAVGRTLFSSDDTSSAAPVAVLNYGYWQRVFGGDSSVVGKTISLNGVLFTIVGVAESRFIGLTPGNIYDIWIPLSVELRLEQHWRGRQNDVGSWWLLVVGRLRPGTPLAQA